MVKQDKTLNILHQRSIRTCGDNSVYFKLPEVSSRMSLNDLPDKLVELLGDSVVVLGKAEPPWTGEVLLGHVRVELLLPPGGLLQLLALLLVLLPVAGLAGLSAVPGTFAPRTLQLGKISTGDAFQTGRVLGNF